MALRRIIPSLTIFVFTVLFTQTALAAPFNGGAGLEQARMEREQDQKDTLRRLEEEKKPSVDLEEKPPASSAKPGETPFLIEKIEVRTQTLPFAEDVRNLASRYEKKEVTLSQVQFLAEEITDLYRSRGYITCRAYIPPQRLENKVLNIEVLEGKLGDVKVQGLRYFRKENLTRFMERLKAKVIQYEELEKSLRKMNFHPDREVRAVILPGKDLGTSDILLDAKDSFPFHVGAEVNNYGTKLTDRTRYGVTARHSNLFGFDDIFGFRAQWGDDVESLSTQYVVPVGTYGTEIGASFNYTKVGVGREFEILDIEGIATGYKVFFSQPVWGNRFIDLTWTGAFEYKSIENTLLDMPSSRDDLRMFRTGINIDEVDAWGRTFVVNEFTFGTTSFGASDKNDPRLSREGAGASFFKYNGVLNRIHPVYDSTYLFLRANAQFTPDRLLSAEQMDIGGVYSVRGYPQSDYLGDYGAGGSVELRVPCYFIPRDVKVPWTDVPLWNRINFVAFFDGAYAKTRRPAPGDIPSRTFFGAGGGIRIDLPRNFTARFEWAAPTGDKASDRSGSQFTFSISSEFF